MVGVGEWVWDLERSVIVYMILIHDEEKGRQHGIYFNVEIMHWSLLSHRAYILWFKQSMKISDAF